MDEKLEIRHSKTGEYYEMYVNGIFEGNYDTFNEAAKAYEQMKKEESAA